MPTWSDDVILRTVIGQYLTSQGIPGRGTITFTPTTTVYDTDDAVAVSSPITVTLDATGSFSVDLPTTDNVLLTPTGWAYEVSIRINGVKSVNVRIYLPLGDGTDVDLFSQIGRLVPTTTSGKAPSLGVSARGPIEIGRAHV